MRLGIDEISFESPAGLEDRSTYNFVGTDPREELEVRFEFPAGGATPSDQVIAKLHTQLDGFPVAGFSIDPPSERDVAGVRGQQLRYVFEDGGETMQAVTVVANLGNGTHTNDWVKFSWTFALPAAEADKRVDAVLASLAGAEQPAPAPLADGWVRRRAGAWALDLPAGLSFPRTHSWADVDARLSISITVTELDAEPPVLDEPLVHAADRGEDVVDRSDLPLQDGELMCVHLRDDELDAERLVCRSVQVHEFGDPARKCYVLVDAAAPWSAEARLRALVDDLLASVRKEPHP